MARAFEAAFHGDASAAHGVQPGFFAWVDGAPAEGYRAPRTGRRPPRLGHAAARAATHPVAVLTGAYGAAVLEPLLAGSTGPTCAWSRCANEFFGGNIGVTGLMAASDLAAGAARPSPRATATCCPTSACPRGASSTAPTPDDLPRPVEVVPTDGVALRAALDLAAGPRGTTVPVGAGRG